MSAAPSKSNGGLIGPINVTELSEPLQKLLKTMKPGQVTQPIRVAKGYQILKLETLKETSVQPFDERAGPGRRAGRTPSGSARKCASSSPASRGQAIIEWKNAELKKAYDQVVAQTAPAVS